MSNDASKNPIIIDTVGDVTIEKHSITVFNVVPSSTNWEVILHSTGSALYSKLFRAFGADKRSYNLPLSRPKPTQGIYATTLTSITEVEVYTDAGD